MCTFVTWPWWTSSWRHHREQCLDLYYYYFQYFATISVPTGSKAPGGWKLRLKTSYNGYVSVFSSINWKKSRYLFVSDCIVMYWCDVWNGYVLLSVCVKGGSENDFARGILRWSLAVNLSLKKKLWRRIRGYLARLQSNLHFIRVNRTIIN